MDALLHTTTFESFNLFLPSFYLGCHPGQSSCIAVNTVLTKNNNIMRVSFVWSLLYQNFVFGDLTFSLSAAGFYLYHFAFHRWLLEYLLDPLCLL